MRMAWLFGVPDAPGVLADLERLDQVLTRELHPDRRYKLAPIKANSMNAGALKTVLDEMRGATGVEKLLWLGCHGTPDDSEKDLVYLELEESRGGRFHTKRLWKALNEVANASTRPVVAVLDHCHAGVPQGVDVHRNLIDVLPGYPDQKAPAKRDGGWLTGAFLDALIVGEPGPVTPPRLHTALIARRQRDGKAGNLPRVVYGDHHDYPVNRLGADPMLPRHATPPAAGRRGSTLPAWGAEPFVGRVSEQKWLDTVFAAANEPRVAVLHGQPGVGKSGLARYWANHSASRYPGGVHRIDAITTENIVEGLLDLARRFGSVPVGPRDPQDLKFLRATQLLGELPTLVILDDVPDASTMRDTDTPLGLPVGVALHLLVTTHAQDWPPGLDARRVDPLPEADGACLFRAWVGPTAPELAVAMRIAKACESRPVALRHEAVEAQRRLRRDGYVDWTALEARIGGSLDGCFERAFKELPALARDVVRAAAHVNPRSLHREVVAWVYTAWRNPVEDFEAGWAAAVDYSWVEGGREPWMHDTVSAWVCKTTPEDAAPGLNDAVRRQWRDRADEVESAPTDARRRMLFHASQPPDSVVQDPRGGTQLAFDACVAAARAHLELGRYAAAEALGASAAAHFVRAGGLDVIGLTRAARWRCAWGDANAHQGRFEAQAEVLLPLVADVDTRYEPTDSTALGQVLHDLGYSLSARGQFPDALPWYQRAVKHKEKGDLSGRVDSESLGSSLHAVGSSLFGQGHFADALPWFQRAVEQAEKGDLHGRVDPDSLGASLHAVGSCLFSQGHVAGALQWFQRAVKQAEKGDLHGRVNPESLGSGLHAVGSCLSSQGHFADALPWFQRAVDQAEKGDLHGRVDPESLGLSLHQVGFCHSSQGHFADAFPWYQRAVVQKEKGDLHGRIDPESLGVSLHEVGSCLSSQGHFADALPWFQRAVDQAEKGNLHGRVNPESLGVSLHEVGSCHSRLDHFADALPWFQGAVEQAEKGDLHGRVNPETVSVLKHSLAACVGAVSR